MNKKAEKKVYGFVVAILIAAIALILIINLIIGIDNMLDESAKRKQCQTSIEGYIQASRLSAGFASPEINCPTEYTTIEGDKEEIKREVMNKAKDCWELWKKGEYFFTQSSEFIRFCHVCEVFDFENKEITIREQEMREYCEKNSFGKEKITDYFMPVFEPHVEDLKLMDWSGLVCREIDSSKRYAILYTEYTDVITQESIESKYTPEQIEIISAQGPVGIQSQTNWVGFWNKADELFTWLEIKLGWDQELDVHMAAPLTIEYAAEELSQCYMTISD